MKTCQTCGNPYKKNPREAHWQYEGRKFCGRRCIRQPVRPIGPKTRYRKTKVNGRPMQAHRHVMEEYLGRPLRWDEYVHHKNDDRTDNRIENLEIMDPVTHGRHHHLRKSLTTDCVICGKTFTPHKTKRERTKTCGRECRGKLIWRVRRAGA